MTEIVYKKESYAIIGACFEVYNDKRCGFLEPVYQECLGIEFEQQRIPAIAKPSLILSYRGRILKQTYEPELRLLRENYCRTESRFRINRRASCATLKLSATGSELGLLVNFGHYPKLEYKRIAKTQHSKPTTDLSVPHFDLFAHIRVIRGLIKRVLPGHPPVARI